MELKNIFKMEIFKNRSDSVYLRIIAILTVMAAIASVLGVLSMKNVISSGNSMIITLAVFTIIGLVVFALLYPFHLLNVDYKNKVISLIFASGVPRDKYYFVKISATILSCLAAVFVVLLIPMITFLVVYPNEFVEFIQNIIKNFNASNIFAFVLSFTFKLIANIVILTTAVIITKGKTVGIFLYFAFLFAISIVESTIRVSFFDYTVSSFTLSNGVSERFYFDTLSSIVQVAVFALIGLQVLKKQDL